MDEEESESGKTGRKYERGKGLMYKLPNKVAQKNRENNVDNNGMSASELRSLASDFADDIDIARMKCGNLHGVIDCVFKNRTIGLRDAIECLVDRLDKQGDTGYLKTRNIEVATENKRLKKEIEKLELAQVQKNREIDNCIMYEKMEDKYVQVEKERERERKLWKVNKDDKNGEIEEAPQDTRSLIDKEFPALRPFIKGIRKILTSAGPATSLDALPPRIPTTRVDERAPPTMNREVEPSAMMSSLSSTMERRPSGRPGRKKKNISNEQVDEIDRLEERNKQMDRENKGNALEGGQSGSGGAGRGRPRIIEDVRIMPPRGGFIQEGSVGYRQVGGPGRMGRPRQEEPTDEVFQEEGGSSMQSGGEWIRVPRRRGGPMDSTGGRTTRGRIDSSRSNNKQKRPPRNAVVAIRARNENVSYAKVLRKARQGVSLEEIGVKATKIKKSINGSLLIEIPGQEGRDKAKVMADKLMEILDETEVAITRPTAMAEMRILGLNESTTRKEVLGIVAKN